MSPHISFAMASVFIVGAALSVAVIAREIGDRWDIIKAALQPHRKDKE